MAGKWYAIPNATESEYTKKGVQLGDSGNKYTCKVSNNAGSVTSDTAILTVVEEVKPPVITQQPENIDKFNGETATFSITVTETNPEFQ